MDTHALLINVLLYVFLPLWGIAGFVDWCCHRASRIEVTSGLKESLLHSLMGIQIAIPILLCLLYRVNVLILLICLLAWVLHEAVAHYASPHRDISVWEMHAHTYLGSLPLYMLSMIVVINWPVMVAWCRSTGRARCNWSPWTRYMVARVTCRSIWCSWVCGAVYRREPVLPATCARQTGVLRMSVFITSTGHFLPGEPVNNERIEAVLGQVHGKPSRLKRRILQSNGILQRHYTIDADHNTRYSNSEMAARAGQACLISSTDRSIGSEMSWSVCSVG